MEPFELDPNSGWPNLAGRVCERLVVEEYLHRGEVIDPANVTWIRLESAWHRLYFDCATFYWRSSDSAPKPYEMPEIHASVRLVDLGSKFGLTGLPFSGIEGRAIEGGAEAILRFAGGRAVALHNVADRTDYVVE